MYIDALDLTRHDQRALECYIDQRPTDQQALALADWHDTAALMAVAQTVRDHGFHNLMTYSRKVFIPVTQLCRNVCHYCTFAKTPRALTNIYMTKEQVLEAARQGEAMGCKEALFTLGERPELRYREAREFLRNSGFSSTLEYVADLARAVHAETGLLVHINAGCMSSEEIAQLRPVSASMGVMLETSAERLSERGMPHFGSPDKDPARRLQTIAAAGELQVPFTSGILIGIGETREERIESLLALRKLHDQYGHLQEIIVQNFRAKPDTKMATAAEPTLQELQWTIAVARLIFGPHMSIQAPPNLSPGMDAALIDAGINDWGGISPLTPDYVNPEAPWPNIQQLTEQNRQQGKYLTERLTVYPRYATDYNQWLDRGLHTKLLQMVDAEGYPRTDDWLSGSNLPVPEAVVAELRAPVQRRQVSTDVVDLVAVARRGQALTDSQIERLFAVRGADLAYVVQQADQLRAATNGERVSYVINRNINYTNICYFKCQFCAFSKGQGKADMRGKPYNLGLDEIARRTREAWQRGATEVCMQGGIHPDYDGNTYLDILRAVKSAAPDIHVHAFSPLEVWQGAESLGLSVENFLLQLKAAGLASLPGTAAEVLDDEVRAVLCPDKITTEQWLQVIETAHRVGLKTTATIMFGHVDHPRHWARHLNRVRDLQRRSGGITEFVPLPFVHMEAPLYRKGLARKGPTFRESILMHSVARLVLHGCISNIQTSWVKLGEQGIAEALLAGANDVGGSLMDESITRAAGASHGQEKTTAQFRQLIARLNRQPEQRTTLYQTVEKSQSTVVDLILPIALVNSAPSQSDGHSCRSAQN